MKQQRRQSERLLYGPLPDPIPEPLPGKKGPRTPTPTLPLPQARLTRSRGTSPCLELPDVSSGRASKRSRPTTPASGETQEQQGLQEQQQSEEETGATGERTEAAAVATVAVAEADPEPEVVVVVAPEVAAAEEAAAALACLAASTASAGSASSSLSAASSGSSSRGSSAANSGGSRHADPELVTWLLNPLEPLDRRPARPRQLIAPGPPPALPIMPTTTVAAVAANADVSLHDEAKEAAEAAEGPASAPPSAAAVDVACREADAVEEAEREAQQQEQEQEQEQEQDVQTAGAPQVSEDGEDGQEEEEEEEEMVFEDDGLQEEPEEGVAAVTAPRAGATTTITTATTTTAAAATQTAAVSEAEDRRLAERLFLQMNGPARPPRRGPSASRELGPKQVRAALTRLVKEVLRPSWLEVREIKPRPNAFYDQLRRAAPHVVESLVLHGTKKEYADGIEREGFNPDKILFCGDDGTTTDRFFFFATCPAIAERWRKAEEVTPDDRVVRHIVVSTLLWLPGSCIKLSGCTGGTIKLPQHAHLFVQPVLRVRYESERTADLPTFPDGVQTKHQLEAAPGFQLEDALMRRMITTRGDMDAVFLSQFR